jgi:hypothetical protein
MFDRIARWQPDRGAAVAARTVGALALAALAVVHVVDLPGTLGPDRLVGIGYLGIIAAAVLIGGVDRHRRPGPRPHPGARPPTDGRPPSLRLAALPPAAGQDHAE